MAAYPSIGLQYEIAPANRRRIEISEAGGVRFINLGAATVYNIKLVHPIINATDRDTLLAFYTTNKNNVNTITLAGQSYNVHFLADYAVETLSAAWFTLTVAMVGTK